MKPEPITPEEQELARIWPERYRPKVFRKQCKAHDANSGLQCGLLEHGPEKLHATARGQFSTVLAPGAQPFSLAELARHALTGSGIH